jgi:hypothetical protein
MNALFTVLISILLSSIGWSHAFHVALAKAEYNSLNSTIEVTLEIDAQDFEHWLEDHGVSVKHVELIAKNSEPWKKVNTILLNHFGATTAQGKLQFDMLGMEAMKDGRLFIYLVAEQVKPFQSIDWKFSLLMDHDPGQQNKLEMVVNKKKYYAVFLQDKKTVTITPDK